jgi:hypothetical protein
MTDQEIEVTVVVSGQPERIRIATDQRVEHLVRASLRKSGNEGQPPADWDLRTESGNLVDQEQKIHAAGIQDGMTLFLSPKAGAGG